jgi:hypothetical protein
MSDHVALWVGMWLAQLGNSNSAASGCIAPAEDRME